MPSRPHGVSPVPYLPCSFANSTLTAREDIVPSHQASSNWLRQPQEVGTAGTKDGPPCQGIRGAGGAEGLVVLHGKEVRQNERRGGRVVPELGRL